MRTKYSKTVFYIGNNSDLSLETHNQRVQHLIPKGTVQVLLPSSLYLYPLVSARAHAHIYTHTHSLKAAFIRASYLWLELRNRWPLHSLWLLIHCLKQQELLNSRSWELYVLWPAQDPERAGGSARRHHGQARWAQGCGCEAPIAGHLPPCCSGGRCRRRHPPCARQGEGSLIIATNIRKNIKHRDRFDVISQLKCNATWGKMSFCSFASRSIFFLPK